MAGPDFSTIGAQIAYWEQHITKRFRGGWSGSGENGYDFGMPQGTPVYALTGGTVVGHGYYGGGGVISVEQQRGTVWYYQHLDLAEPGIESGRVTTVQAGQLIGWSGGQLSGGNHPSSSKFSSGPHIEVGINAPWGGIWGPQDQKGPNIDPWPVIQAIARGEGTATTGTPGEPGAASPGGIHLNYPGGSLDLNWPDWLGGVRNTFGTLFTWLTDPLRILKLVGGVLVIGIAVTLVVVGLTVKVGPDALQVAGVATAQPELVAAGRAAKAAKKGNAKPAASSFAKTRRKPKPAKAPAPPTTPAAPRPAASSAPKEDEGEPVYMDGRRVGTSKGGKITMDQGKQAS